MNEPETERSGLSMLLSTLIGAGAGAALGKYGTRYLPAVKATRDPGFMKEGGKGWDLVKQFNEDQQNIFDEIAKQRGRSRKRENTIPTQDDLDGARTILEHQQRMGANMFAGIGGTAGAGLGLAFAPQHEVYEDPLR